MSEWLLRKIHAMVNLRAEYAPDSYRIPIDCGYCLDRYLKSEHKK